MATANDVIVRAFTMAGIRASETPLTADELADGLDLLNDLASEWGTSSVIPGFAPVENVGDDLRIPRQAYGAVKAELAVRIAPEFGKPVTIGMIRNQEESMSAMLRATMDLEVRLPDTLPIGSGNTPSDYWTDQVFYAQKDKRNF